MSIRQWHPGQLVVLWVAAVLIDVLIVLTLVIAEGPHTGRALFLARAALVTFLVIPFLMLIVTWRWFGGRARR